MRERESDSEREREGEGKREILNNWTDCNRISGLALTFN